MDIHLSSLGFIDPVMTSAGTAGMTEHLAMGSVIKDNKIHAPFIDMKTNKIVTLTPEDTVGKIVAFPDGPSKDGLNKAVLDGEMVEVTKDKIDYTVPNAKYMFSNITNLIPFIQNDSGSRAIFGTGQYTQAVTLEDREAPLAQTLFSTKNGEKITFEKMIGNQASIISPVGGTVTRVSKKNITIRGGGGSTHTVPLYDNMPLNQSGFLHNNPLVKTGDQVVKGQVLADSNNTKDGVLALGRNLLTAIMPWKGLTYEDGVVISEKAAKRLSSEHLREAIAHLDPNSKVNRDIYISQTRGTRFQISADNEDKLDKLTGLIKPGEIVEPGDVMATIVRKNVDDLGVTSMTQVSQGDLVELRSEIIRDESWEVPWPSSIYFGH
ncbi:MAG: hypothetical protein IIC39_08370 [Candidatus Marinimicrobia bacterium]|nr:hypothetical protein [Candidatus Neomarinimicrobiota bacterium]